MQFWGRKFATPSKFCKLFLGILIIENEKVGLCEISKKKRFPILRSHQEKNQSVTSSYIQDENLPRMIKTTFFDTFHFLKYYREAVESRNPVQSRSDLTTLSLTRSNDSTVAGELMFNLKFSLRFIESCFYALTVPVYFSSPPPPIVWQMKIAGVKLGGEWYINYCSLVVWQQKLVGVKVRGRGN